MRNAALITLAVVAAACAGPAREPAAVPVPSTTPLGATTLVHVQTATGFSTLDLDGRTVATAPGAVASADGHSVFAVDGDVLHVIDGVTGVDRGSRPLPAADLHPVVASLDGRRVALTDSAHRVGDGTLPPGRSRSRIVVAESTSERARGYDLTGNFVPEAFASSEAALYLIQYSPPEHPESYRVRVLRLDTGAVEPALTFEKQVDDEEMRGHSRRQVLSPDGMFLYTLYSRVDGDERYGFIHVLMLGGGLVHCVDLPAELGTVDGGALGISPDGSRLYVLGAGGSLAEIDATEPFRKKPFPVVARVDLPGGGGAAGAVSLAVDGDHVWAGFGDQVVAVDRDGLRPGGRFTMGGPVDALAVGGPDELVAVAGDGLDVVDTTTGGHTRLTTIVGPVEHLTVDASQQ